MVVAAPLVNFDARTAAFTTSANRKPTFPPWFFFFFECEEGDTGGGVLDEGLALGVALFAGGTFSVPTCTMAGALPVDGGGVLAHDSLSGDSDVRPSRPRTGERGGWCTCMEAVAAR